MWLGTMIRGVGRGGSSPLAPTSPTCGCTFPDGHEPEQPRVLVWGGVDSDDLGAIDVDLAEDFAQGFFPQLIGHRRVAPQRPELPQESREDRFGAGGRCPVEGRR